MATLARGKRFRFARGLQGTAPLRERFHGARSLPSPWDRLPGQGSSATCGLTQRNRQAALLRWVRGAPRSLADIRSDSVRQRKGGMCRFPVAREG